ncbi:hypothetical protein E2C01_042424 [Portunus trituberculatus]|uniref:Uncharacterized protein n=1 Tax=Portunus trituberculatus TaxID=210409 RepID=A0A5B7FUM3_PORTR|nr:hypothetical protein [Portunus trituberculatus]
MPPRIHFSQYSHSLAVFPNTPLLLHTPQQHHSLPPSPNPADFITTTSYPPNTIITFSYTFQHHHDAPIIIISFLASPQALPHLQKLNQIDDD